MPLDPHRLASQQVGNKALALLDISQGIALRRVQQAGAETQFAAGRDGGGNTQRRADFPCHHVHPAQATEQWHHRTAIFSHGQHRRFAALLAEQGRQAANDDTGCAQRNDRGGLLVQRPQGVAKGTVVAVGALHAALQAMDQSLWITLLDPLCRQQAARPENDDGRCRVHGQPCHFSPGTMISEKYGDDSGSTWSSGTIF